MMKIEQATKKFLTSLADRNLSEHTIKAYEENLKQFKRITGNIDIDQVTEKHVEEYRGQMKTGGNSASTVNRKLSAVSSFFTYCEKKGMVHTNPVRSIDRPKMPETVPRIFSDTERKRILTNTRNLTHRLMFDVMFTAGLRIEECINLQIQDIDFKNLSIIVQGKGRRERLVPPNGGQLPERFMKDLANHIKDRKTGHTFLNRSGQAFTGPHVLQRAFQRVMERLKMEGHLHMLRATALSNVYAISRDILYTMKFAGHKNPKTTLLYVRTGDTYDLSDL